MQKRNILNSPRLLELKRHRQRAFFGKILISLVALLAIFILLAYLSRIDKLNISEIEVVGNKLVDTEMINGAVKEELAGKYLWLFPKTNIMFYPQSSIKNILQDKFKRLKDINLSVKNEKTLSVSLNERMPKYTWCGEEPSVDAPRSSKGNTNKCYFTDEDGYVFDEAPYFSGDVYFKFYGVLDMSSDVERPTTGVLGYYFFPQNFKKLILFKNTIVGMGLKPVSFYLTKDGDIQVFLSSLASSQNIPKLLLKADADFQIVAENLQAVLNTEPLKSKFKNKYSSLQYIDLRFGNKVYDKFR